MERTQAAKSVNPDFLMDIERVRVRDDATQIIKQRFAITIHKLDKGIGIAALRFGHQKRLFQSLQPALIRALRAWFHCASDKCPRAGDRFKKSYGKFLPRMNTDEHG